VRPLADGEDAAAVRRATPAGVLVAEKRLQREDGAHRRTLFGVPAEELGWTRDELAEIARRFGAALDARGLKRQRMRVDGGQITCCVRGERCPSKGATHRRHSAYAHLRLPPAPPPPPLDGADTVDGDRDGDEDGHAHDAAAAAAPGRHFFWRLPAHLVFACPDTHSCAGTRWYGGDLGPEIFGDADSAAATSFC